MKPRKVLDSSVIIAAQRGSEEADRAIAAALRDRGTVLPAIVSLEVRAAPRSSKRWRAWVQSLEATLGVTPLDARAAQLGARAARWAARAGRQLGSADAAVVGCGAARNATVIVTADPDFDALPPPFSVERVPTPRG